MTPIEKKQTPKSLSTKTNDSVRLYGYKISKQLFARLSLCRKNKGLSENDIQRTALDEYLSRNNF